MRNVNTQKIICLYIIYPKNYYWKDPYIRVRKILLLKGSLGVTVTYTIRKLNWYSKMLYSDYTFSWKMHFFWE